MILAIKTDQPKSEIYLLSNQGNIIDKIKWQADRKLADTILNQIEKLLEQSHFNFQDLKALIVFTGTGSFTGLRIGTTVANTLAYSLSIPIVSSGGKNWLKRGFELIKSSPPKGQYVVPQYHSEPNITKPKTNLI